MNQNYTDVGKFDLVLPSAHFWSKTPRFRFSLFFSLFSSFTNCSSLLNYWLVLSNLLDFPIFCWTNRFGIAMQFNSIFGAFWNISAHTTRTRFNPIIWRLNESLYILVHVSIVAFDLNLESYQPTVKKKRIKKCAIVFPTKTMKCKHIKKQQKSNGQIKIVGNKTQLWIQFIG